MNQKTKNLIDDLFKKNLLDKNEYIAITNAKSKKDIKNILARKLDQNQQKELWHHIIHNVWKDNDENQCFNEQECIFMKRLILNDGIVEKSDLFKVGVLKTPYKILKTSQRLEELKLVSTIQFNGKTFYCLSKEGLL